jgi:hypothetical protein
MALSMTTPVIATQTTGNPSVSVTVPSGTKAILFFYANETSGAARDLTALGDGTQSAAVWTGAELLGGAGPTLRNEIWVMLNPTIGTSTWTFTVSSSGTGLNDQSYGYAFVTDLDTADPEAGTTTTSGTTSSTARDLTITTDADDALIVSFIVGRDLGDTFTWDGFPITQVYNQGQTNLEFSIATRLATSQTSYNMGGDWSANPTRSNMINIALKPSAVSSPHSITAAGSGTFTAPETATYLVETWGGGAGGGGDDNGIKGGPGGGGGAYSAVLVSLTADDECAYTVGAAGTGGAADAMGTDGGDTEFENPSTTVIARAKGGDAAVDWDGGGVGGAAGSGIGDTKYSGGDGAEGEEDGGEVEHGGGGGSSAGTASNGNNASGATGGTAPTDGGAGGNEEVAGSAPGGGGGGGDNTFTTAGANGAAGKIRITWPISAGQPTMRRWGAVPHMRTTGHRLGGGWG